MKKNGTWYLGLMIVGMFVFPACSPYTAGNVKLKQENYESAISHYREELSENPGHWQARERLGFAYFKAGQYDKAIDELTEVLKQKPGHPGATIYLSLAWLNKGERAKAIEVLETYKNEEMPQVEQQVRRQLTLLQISESIHLAKKALAEEERLQASSAEPGSVAVFYFEDLSPESSFRHLQKALAEMIITDLSYVQSLQVVERLRIQALLAEMELGQTGIVEQGTAPRAGRLLGAENLVVGTFKPGSVLVDSSVASTSQQNVVGGFSVGAEEQQFFELQKEIVFNILQVLRVSLTPEEEQLVNRYHTKSFKAVVYYGQGLEAFDAGKWKEARDFFDKALKEDPNFLLARWQRDACPDPSAPSLAQLESMSDLQLSRYTEEKVYGAVASQQASNEADRGSEGHDAPEPEQAEPTGSVSVSW